MAIKKGEIIGLNIDDAAFKGKGIGKIDGKAVFVPNTAPGDRVTTRIIKRKKSYLEGKLVEVLEPGPNRIEPRCKHAQACGGCSWQHVDYETQLSFKQAQVRNHMQRIGHMNNLQVNATLGCDTPFYYRNKMEYSIGNKRWLSRKEINSTEFVSDRCFAAGLHAPGRFDKILNIQECFLQGDSSYQILDFVRNYCINHDIKPYNRIDHKGFMRNVMIRNAYHTADLMVNLVTYKDDQEIMSMLADALLKAFPKITTIINNVNDRRNPTAIGRYEKTLFGPGFITDYIGKYAFKIQANSFFQTNTAQAGKLYDVVKQYADIQRGETVYDLYCGVGTLSLYLSSNAHQIVGIEQVAVAVQDAIENAKSNQVSDVQFIKGDIKDVFNEKLTDKFGPPDCLITDPPRAGMHPAVVEQLKMLKAQKLVYISCDSSTMARDLKELKEVYDIQELQPVDMFPQTYHIETVAKLHLKA